MITTLARRLIGVRRLPLYCVPLYCVPLYCVPLCALVIGDVAIAQVLPDNTLSTQVIQRGDVFDITDGKQVGSNLFHSFSSFSVPTGGEAFFKNATSITNIFGRITGPNPSQIDGLIRAKGQANLTLINPNGLTFGANAQLKIRGSFLGSTAHSLEFADGTTFSAISPFSTPMLTVSTPTGLQFGQSPGPIEVQGSGHNLTAAQQIFSPFSRGEVAGLKVKNGKTLALVGGEINLDGGTLNADRGRIELGSVANGRVSLREIPRGWIFDYGDVADFQDITFRAEALADASGKGAGFIQLQGRNIEVRRGSIVLVQTQGNRDALGLQVNASESLIVRGTRPDGSLSGGLFTETTSTGRGGDIHVSAPTVVVQNGAAIFTGTFTMAAGGKIDVKAAESVNVLGFSRANPSRFSNISATTFGSGPAGGIQIDTSKVLARNGGNIASVTGGIGGTGVGGNVLIKARESIELLGFTPGILTPSQITAGTGGAGDAGNVTLKTQQLTLRNGGRVDASTLAGGNGGSVTIDSPQSVEVSGTIPGSLNPSLINASANIVDPQLRALLQLPDAPSGDAGDLTLTTNQLSVIDGGQVTVRNDGSGDAGTLEINTDGVSLRNQGRLSASTLSGEGGNIVLNTRTLRARENSAISAEAGGAGQGGNIDIIGTNPTEVVVLLDNSDITANAVMGTGGNINIEAQGLFPCATCEISASSALGVDGVINIVSPETDSAREGVNLLEQIIDPEAIVVQACSSTPGESLSELTVTGRGGLPPRPNRSLTSEALIGFAPPIESSEPKVSDSSPSDSSPPEKPELPPPAHGIVISPQGQVLLTAQSKQLRASHAQASPDCQTS